MRLRRARRADETSYIVRALAAASLVSAVAGCHPCMSAEAAWPERESVDRQNDRALATALAAAGLALVWMDPYDGPATPDSAASGASPHVVRAQVAGAPDAVRLVSRLRVLVARAPDGKVHEVVVKRSVVLHRERTICGCQHFGGMPPAIPARWALKLASADEWGSPVEVRVDETELVDSYTGGACRDP